MCKQIEYARWWARENIKQDEIGSDRLRWRKVVTLHKMVRDSLSARGMSHTGIWSRGCCKHRGLEEACWVCSKNRGQGVWNRVSDGE